MESMHLLFGIGDTAMLYGESNERLYVCRCCFVSLYTLCKGSDGRIIGFKNTVDGRESKLTLKHIIARRFANLWRREIVEDVVTYLEDRAEGLSEIGCCLDIIIRCTYRHCTHGTASLKESCCLLAYDTVIGLFANLLRTVAGELEYLSIRESLTKYREIVDDVYPLCLTYI